MFYGEPEGTGFEALDRRFNNLLTGHGRVERVWTGGRWTEGPAWFAAGRYLVFSDIPNNRLMRYDECDGHVSVFRQPSNNCNGNTTDPQGRLVTCEHLTRRAVPQLPPMNYSNLDTRLKSHSLSRDFLQRLQRIREASIKAVKQTRAAKSSASLP